MEPFYSDIWAVSFKKDSLRVIPREFFQETKESRNTYVLKLCNLPRETTAFDILDYIKSIQGKTCFISRTRTKYERVHYAFVAFENKQDMESLL